MAEILLMKQQVKSYKFTKLSIWGVRHISDLIMQQTFKLGCENSKSEEHEEHIVLKLLFLKKGKNQQSDIELTITLLTPFYSLNLSFFARGWTSVS